MSFPHLPAPASSPSNNPLPGRHRGLTVVIIVMMLVIVIVDLLIPLGVATGISYVVPTLLALWLPQRRAVVVIAAIATILIGVGWGLSEPGASPWIIVTNRILVIVAVWIVAVLGLERRRLEAELAVSEGLSRAILSSTAEGILLVDETGAIRTANESVERIFGYEQADLIGRFLGTLFFPGPEGGASLDFEAVRAELADVHDTVIIRKDNSTMNVETLIVPVEVGSAVWYTVTARDVSRRRMLERDVLRTQEEERRELGYGLHENLGQALTGLQLMTRSLARRLEAKDLPEAKVASELAERLSETDALALDLFSGLAPIDARGGFAAAIRQAVSDAAGEAGVEYVVSEHHEAPQQHSHNLDALYRIGLDLTREALHHARPSHLAIDIGVPDRPLTLTLRSVRINDDAAWGDVLERIKYRAKTVDGRLRVENPSTHDLRLSLEI